MFTSKLAVFLMFVAAQIIATNEHEFSVISTTQRPSECQNLNDRLSKVELELEIRSTLKELMSNINQLKETKKTIIEEVESRVKVYHAELLYEMKHQFIEIKKEIIAEINNRTVEKSESGPQENHKNLPTDCRTVQRMGNKTSGIYRIQPEVASEAFLVWCDMTTKGGGWTYVLNRFDGSQNFNLNWTDYKSGFGNLSGEFWLGLEHLHQITNSKSNDLLFELVDWDLEKGYANYGNFRIRNESDGYSLEVVWNCGDAGDSFSAHSGFKFSTPDRDQDLNINNCAASYNSAWWYTAFCFSSNPTAKYQPAFVRTAYGLFWHTFRGANYSFKEIRMMIRPTYS